MNKLTRILSTFHRLSVRRYSYDNNFQALSDVEAAFKRMQRTISWLTAGLLLTNLTLWGLYIYPIKNVEMFVTPKEYVIEFKDGKKVVKQLSSEEQKQVDQIVEKLAGQSLEEMIVSMKRNRDKLQKVEIKDGKVVTSSITEEELDEIATELEKEKEK